MKVLRSAGAVSALSSGSAAPHMSLQEKKSLAYAKKGVLLALLSGIIFSLNGILLHRSAHYTPFSRPELWVLAPLICGGVHDLCAAAFVTLNNWRQGRLKEVGRSFLSRPGRPIIFGALAGSLVGMGGYMMSLRLAGPAYALPLTSLYPAVASVLAVFILKERIVPRAWGGLLLCIAGAVVIGYTPPSSQTGPLFYWGLVCAALAAVGWGTEGVYATLGMDFIEPAVALNMYYTVSCSLYFLFLIPAASLYILPDVGGVSVLGEFLTSPGLIFVALTGGLGALSYKCWYASMNMTGVSRSMAINISYALWGLIFSAIFTDVEITRNLIAGALVIFVGMFLVIGNPKDMMDLRKIE